VPRVHVVVRPLTPADTGAVLEMWEELRQYTGRTGTLAPVPSETRLRQVMAEVADDDSYRAVVAALDGTVVGMAVFMARPLGPFMEARVVQIDYLHVREAFHRRGVGRALVAAAAGYADEIGSEHVSVNVLPQVREANRFYAKIGFTPLAVRRVASVGTLRRSLGLEAPVRGARAGLLARRRSAVRARATTGV
jgi:ribosomal protein S18 acetylase RimI-like enzyme